MIDQELEERMKREHRAKYQSLAVTLGWDDLARLVPIGSERIDAALAAGDEHLNRFGNSPWDNAALGARHPALCFPPELWRSDWPAADLWRSARNLPWSRVPTLSLSERVCALKYVAREESRKRTGK